MSFAGSDTENSLEMEEEDDESQINVIPGNVDDCTPGSGVNVVGTPPSSCDAFEMACSFVRWYYPLINGSLDCDTDFGSQHFWVDASAQLSLQSSGISGSKENTSVEDNGKMAAELLKEVVRKHRVTFNPNASKEGVHGVIDAHGLAIVTGKNCR